MNRFIFFGAAGYNTHCTGWLAFMQCETNVVKVIVLDVMFNEWKKIHSWSC